MPENTPPERAPISRAGTRTNLFVAATLRTNGEVYPVTIRDLSAAGAQIESSLLLEVGAEVTLSRGHLSVRGQVTWGRNRRCGLHFASPISVQDWMPSPVHRQQQRVDHVVAAVKAGARPPKVPAELPVSTTSDAAQDLKQVSRLLEILSDALASDPAVVVKHGLQIQNLDIALQTLTVLAGTLRADDPDYAASLARLAELRISCAQALRAET